MDRESVPRNVSGTVANCKLVESDNIMAKTVRVLATFFLATESGQTSNQPLRKEKFHVPLSERDHEELHNFKQHLIQFTGLTDIAFSMG